MKKNGFFLSLCILLTYILSIPVSASELDLDLTPEESRFIQEHPEITMGVDPLFVPFEFIDEDGSYKGITADYLNLISERTGLVFTVRENLTWPQAYDLALSGEVDMLPAISKTPEREEHFLFSHQYYEFKRVLVTRESDTDITSMDDLEGLTVAVQRNSSHHSYLLSQPEINLSLYDSVENALTAVANGTERAFVGNIATTNYLIRSTGLTNLRFTAFQAEEDQGLHFAVRKDWPQLVSILDKAVGSISQEERIAINNRWIGLDTHVDYSGIIRVVAMIGLLMASILGVSFYWNIKLRSEITVRKQVQEDLEKAKREAEEANEFKSSFLARMSHEIRTPLNAITGMSYLLKKTGLSPTQKTYTERITQASNNMLSIVNDILDYSKIESGKVELETVSFNLDRVIQDVVSIATYKIEEQGIGFRLSKDPQLANWYFGDSKRIEQVLLNLLNNSAKFTNSGEVSLDIKLVAKENDTCHIAFTIRDTGIGMSRDQVDNLFMPFVQGDTSINRRFGGSGLGLSIVKNLVDMMDGKIQVYSTQGEGSTFIVNLSLKVDEESESEYLKVFSARHFEDIKTLILEKSGTNMNLIESYLGSFGMECEITSSPDSAVRMLEAPDGVFSKAYDLFIVDYDSTTNDAFLFVEELRRNRSLAKMPRIIMLLPMMRDDLFDLVQERNIDIGIGKPIIPSVLLDGILDTLNIIPDESGEKISMAKTEVGMNSGCVLVVEDNTTNQMIARSLLDQVGIETITALNGQEGVEAFRANRDRIDLILMDLHMPLMNGYDAAVEIRKESGDVPIIAMTADVVLGVEEKCRESGIDGYISKPFDPDMFIEMVQTYINRGQVDVQDEETYLDTSAGIRNMGGSSDLYHKVLGQYRDENMETLSLFNDMINSEDYREAAGLMHKLKSSSATIGATRLYDLAKDLQRALEEEKVEIVERIGNEFSLVFENVMKEIDKRLKSL